MKSILLVTGNTENVITLSSLLLNWGYGVAVKSDAASALSLIREGVDVDAAIVEYGLTDALDFFTELKRTASDSLPVIFLSDRVDVQDYLNALSLGAFDFLFWPIVPGELLRILKVAVKRYAENRRVAESAGESSLSLFDGSREGESQSLSWLR